MALWWPSAQAVEPGGSDRPACPGLGMGFSATRARVLRGGRGVPGRALGADLRVPVCPPHRASSRLQFLCLKNIRTFLKVCHDKFGLRSSELFDPFDLFDVRDFGKVSGLVQALPATWWPSVGGPRERNGLPPPP